MRSGKPIPGIGFARLPTNRGSEGGANTQNAERDVPSEWLSRYLERNLHRLNAVPKGTSVFPIILTPIYHSLGRHRLEAIKPYPARFLNLRITFSFIVTGSARGTPASTWLQNGLMFAPT